jgi:HK97 family phage prohead protease
MTMNDKSSRGVVSRLAESRSFPTQFELRAGTTAKRMTLTGYASTTEQPYKMYDMFGEYSEVVRAGAFSKTLDNKADVAFLANHGGMTLARTKNGTLTLSEDSTGLLSVADLNTERQDVRDLLTAVEDGDIDEMSFAFRVDQQLWSPDYDERSMIELNLDRGDVSAVNYGANPTTSIGVQRAFRSQKAARLFALANEVRESGQLSPDVAETVSQLLTLLANGEEKIEPVVEEIVDVTKDEAPVDLSFLASLTKMKADLEDE